MTYQEHSDPAGNPIEEPALIHKVELALSYILRGGVLISITLVLIGTFLTFSHHPELAKKALPTATIPQTVAPSFPHTIPEMIGSVGQMRGQGFIVLGLLVLLLTPVVRVAASIVAFGIQRDWVFVCITTVVLAILILSFILGKGEGTG